MKIKLFPIIFFYKLFPRKIKLFFCSLLFCIFINTGIQAQYKLERAFPNLPSFSIPTEFVHAGDSTNRLFVAQLKGIIYVFDNSPTVSTRKEFINISSKVSQPGFEAGLLGLAFHPNYQNNRYFYVHYVFDSTGSPSGQWVRISRFTASSTNLDTAFIESEKILLTISLPASAHNGGQVEFGTDNYLYIAVGDGYNGGNEAQDKTKLLGKILRLNVDSSSNGNNYSIPSTNPFYGNTQGWKEEIYAYGFRNPWRFSIDEQTNAMWLGDVGQNRYEEVNLVKNGKNYGWNKMEGLHCYPDTNICDTAGMGYTRPIWEYSHANVTQAYAVVCGPIYRGSLLPELYGKVIFGDYAHGIVNALTYNGINPATSQQLVDTTFFISSFGEDQYNEMYVCRISPGFIYRLSNSSVTILDLKVIIEGLYNLSSNKLNMRDTVTVSLHSAVSPFQIVDETRTVIDSLLFNGLCFFNNTPDGTYYISVKHRNGLETWSKAGGETFVRGSVTTYDFTNDTTKSYGSNAKLKGIKYCLISGDCNQNGVINAVDRAIVIGQIGSQGYLAGDLDGNGVINAVDRAIIVSNLGRSKLTP